MIIAMSDKEETETRVLLEFESNFLRLYNFPFGERDARRCSWAPPLFFPSSPSLHLTFPAALYSLEIEELLQEFYNGKPREKSLELIREHLGRTF